MSDTLYFSRDTIVHLQPSGSGDVYRIPVQDGFSFSQATNATEITLNEAASQAGVSRRGRAYFNDSYAPAEWSMQVYLRPFEADSSAGAGNHGDGFMHAVEEAIWDAFVSSTVGGGLNPGGSELEIDFSNSNNVLVGKFDLYFEMGSDKANPTVYKIADCVVDSLSLDIDIDGIASMTASGFGRIIEDTGSAMPSATIFEGARSNDTGNYIRQKLTSLAIAAADDTTYPGDTGDGVYNVVLTGGNITFNNNITYLTPETLGEVNQPLGHVTGARAVSGNFTCYLNRASGSSADLFEDLIEGTDVVTNSFDLKFAIGGSTSPTRVEIELGQCHLEIPTHSIEDVVGVEVNFHALPSNISETDEATVKYIGEPVTTGA